MERTEPGESFDVLVHKHSLPEPYRHLVIPSSWLLREQPSAKLVKQRPSLVDLGIQTIEDFYETFPESEGEHMLRRYLSGKVGERFQRTRGCVIAMEQSHGNCSLRDSWETNKERPTLEEFKILYPDNLKIYDGMTRIFFSLLRSDESDVTIDPHEPVHIMVFRHGTPEEVMAHIVDNLQDEAEHMRSQQDSCLVYKLINRFECNSAPQGTVKNVRDIRTKKDGIQYWSFKSVVDRFIKVFPHYASKRDRLEQLAGIARLAPLVREYLNMFLKYPANDSKRFFTLKMLSSSVFAGLDEAGYTATSITSGARKQRFILEKAQEIYERERNESPNKSALKFTHAQGPKYFEDFCLKVMPDANAKFDVPTVPAVTPSRSRSLALLPFHTTTCPLCLMEPARHKCPNEACAQVACKECWSKCSCMVTNEGVSISARCPSCRAPFTMRSLVRSPLPKDTAVNNPVQGNIQNQTTENNNTGTTLVVQASAAPATQEQAVIVNLPVRRKRLRKPSRGRREDGEEKNQAKPTRPRKKPRAPTSKNASNSPSERDVVAALADGSILEWETTIEVTFSTNGIINFPKDIADEVGDGVFRLPCLDLDLINDGLKFVHTVEAEMKDLEKPWYHEAQDGEDHYNNEEATRSKKKKTNRNLINENDGEHQATTKYDRSKWLLLKPNLPSDFEFCEAAMNLKSGTEDVAKIKQWYDPNGPHKELIFVNKYLNLEETDPDCVFKENDDVSVRHLRQRLIDSRRRTLLQQIEYTVNKSVDHQFNHSPFPDAAMDEVYQRRVVNLSNDWCIHVNKMKLDQNQYYEDHGDEPKTFLCYGTGADGTGMTICTVVFSGGGWVVVTYWKPDGEPRRIKFRVEPGQIWGIRGWFRFTSTHAIYPDSFNADSVRWGMNVRFNQAPYLQSVLYAEFFEHPRSSLSETLQESYPNIRRGFLGSVAEAVKHILLKKKNKKASCQEILSALKRAKFMLQNVDPNVILKEVTPSDDHLVSYELTLEHLKALMQIGCNNTGYPFKYVREHADPPLTCKWVVHNAQTTCVVELID